MSRPLDPDQFATHRATLSTGATLAYLREGVGGVPLVLVHGWPETRRIWWRNVEALVAAGFEVIAPDLRGFGDSSLAPDECYDVAAFSMDLQALVREELGHSTCFAAGGDAGGPIVYDLSLRYTGLVPKLCFFNTLTPVLVHGEYEAAGIPPDPDRRERATADYFVRQSTDADALAAELDTPERRRAYVAGMYGHRLWGTPTAFTRDEIDFMTEPFAAADKLRGELRDLRERHRQPSDEGRATVPRDERHPDAGALRPGGPRGARRASRRVAASPSPSASAPSWSPARVTSCNGSPPTSSTGRSSTSSSDRPLTPRLRAHGRRGT